MLKNKKHLRLKVKVEKHIDIVVRLQCLARREVRGESWCPQPGLS